MLHNVRIGNKHSTVAKQEIVPRHRTKLFQHSAKNIIFNNVIIINYNTNYNKKYVLWNAGICPIASKVGQVTLATPPFWVIHHRLYTTSSNGSNRENTKSLAQKSKSKIADGRHLGFSKI